MEMTTLGNTGLEISRLGTGLAEIGKYELAQDDVEVAGRVLGAALDSGVNFLDTAACYGNSEELVGRAVSHRRDEYVLATKCGHATGGYTGRPWTAQTITDSIDRSLARLNTDHLDLVQLHSCDVGVLGRGEAAEALLKARDAGKTRFVGYSGDDEAARVAIESGVFETLQTSFSLVDQQARTKLFPLAEKQGMGIIVKRPIANGTWGAESSPSNYATEYFRRARLMADMGPIPGAPGDRILLALGFIFAHAEVDTAIVGTGNPAHMLGNIDLLDRLPIFDETVQELRRRFDELGVDWVGLE